MRMMTIEAAITTTDTARDREADQYMTRTIAGPGLTAGRSQGRVPKYDPFEGGESFEKIIHVASQLGAFFVRLGV